MDDDWATDGEGDGLGDLSDIPQVELPPALKKASSEPVPLPPANIQPSTPPRNAWANPTQSDHIRAPPQNQQPNLNRLQNSLPTALQSNIHSNSHPNNPHSTSLYAANLPYQTNEQAIQDFFTNYEVNVLNIRLLKHPNTVKIKAAIISIAADHLQKALATDGKLFGGRAMHVKIEGTDSRRGRERERDRDRDRDRIHTRTASFGSSFPSRPTSNPSWQDRGPGSSFDSQFNRRQSDPIREDRRNRISPASDPSIPTGPPPAGRKKLNLKPRTKPPPQLQVDQRVVDSTKTVQSPPSAKTSQEDETPMPAAAKPEGQFRKVINGERFSKGDRSSPRFDKFDRRDRGRRDLQDDTTSWSSPKETSLPRPNSQTSLKKEDDSKRPVLLNTFAALELNDPDA